MAPIKPCPFCACAHIENVELHDQPGDAFVVCRADCGAAGPAGLDENLALELWNDRKQ